MTSRVFACACVAFSLFLSAPRAFAQADVEAGKNVFTQKCQTCHTLSTDPAHGLTGPNLMGVIDRTAGTVEGWEFSPALKASGLVWNDENLHKWLTDPMALVPGSVMALKMPNKAEREDVIAYIRSVSPPSK
jgi:cytochrome c